jgi:hypothetical protein
VLWVGVGCLYSTVRVVMEQAARDAATGAKDTSGDAATFHEDDTGDEKVAAKLTEKQQQQRRREDALMVRARMLDDGLSALTRLAWLPPACGACGLPINPANIKKRYKLLAVYLHPDKLAALGVCTEDGEDELGRWAKAYKRLRDARDELLGFDISSAIDEDDADDADAVAHLAAGRVHEAEQRYAQLSSRFHTEFGRNHPRTVRTQRRLADVLHQHTNRHGEAEVLYRCLLSGSKNALGEHHADHLRVAGGLGRLLKDKGDLAAAEPLLRKSTEGLLALGLGSREAPSVEMSKLSLT